MQSSGSLMRLWRRTHVKEPPQPLTANQEKILGVETEILTPKQVVPSVEGVSHTPLSLPAREKHPSEEPTQLLSTITSSKVSQQLHHRLVAPPFVEYRRADTPLIMLYGATLACMSQLQRMPDVLFISSEVYPSLRRQYDELFHTRFKGWFHFPTGEKMMEYIPVYTEKQLPDVVAMAMNNTISRDTVIGMGEK